MAADVTKLTTLSARAACLVPRRLWTLQGPSSLQRSSGVVLFADIAGFTAMTERARRRHGERGIEVLTQRLNIVFKSMVDVVATAGGDVLKFGGDALLVAFDDQRSPHDRWSAPLWCADRLQRLFRRGRHSVSGGSLSLRVGMSYGGWQEAIVGAVGGRREHFVDGAAIADAIDASGEAVQRGCLIRASRPLLPRQEHVRLTAAGRGRWTVVPPKRPWGHPTPVSKSADPLADNLSDFIPTLLRSRLSDEQFVPLDAGEHRRVCTLFLFWKHSELSTVASDRHSTIWDDVHRCVSDAAQTHTGLWARSDPGGPYQKILILFGAPVAAADDVDRALCCAADLCDRFTALQTSHRRVRFGIGLTVGSVYTGYVGAPGRYEFTAMGDAVNLAARLASKAPSGAVYVDAQTASQSGRWRFRPGPSLRLKGVARSVPVLCPIERLAEEAATDDDAVVEHPFAMKRALSLLQEVPRRSIEVVAAADTDPGRFARQLADRLGHDDCFIMRHRFRPQTESHPHSGLTDWLKSLGHSAPIDSEQHNGARTATEHAVEAALRNESAFTRSISRVGAGAWAERVARYVATHPVLVSTGHDHTLHLLEEAQSLSAIDRAVFESLRRLHGQRWQLVLLRREHGTSPETADDSAVRLAALSQLEMRTVIGETLGHAAIPNRLVGFVQAKSRGLPRIARLFVTGLLTGGHLRPHRKPNDSWRLLALDDASLPTDLRAHYIQRVDALSPQAILFARTLAVLGGSISESGLRAVSGEPDCARAIEELHRAGLVTADTAPQRTIEFIEPACRDAVYETMSYAGREALHRRAVAYWRREKVRGRNEVAEHLFWSRDPKAHPPLLASARRARRLWALDRAARFYRWALLALDRRFDDGTGSGLPPMPASLNDVHRAVLNEFADVLQQSGQYVDSIRLYDRLARDARSRRAKAQTGAYRLSMARVAWLSGRYGIAERVAASVQKSAARSRNQTLEAHALSILADTFRRTGRLVKARDALHRAIAVYRRGRDDEAWADAQNALGLVEWNAGQLETARECFQDAMSRMSGRSGPLKRGRVANNLGLLFEEAGRLTVARRYYERAFRIFDRLGHTRNRSYCLGNLGNLHRHAARYEHARNAYEEAQHEFRAIGEQHAAAYTTGNLGDLAFDFGNAQQALSLYQRTLEFAVSVGDLELVAESCARVASVHLAAGRADQARRFIRESHQAATQARSQEFLLRARLLAADLTTSDGKHADALHEYERAADDSTETGLLFYRLWAQYGRAHCALSGDRLIEAGEIAQAGSRDAHRAGYTWWELRFAVINARTQSHVSATHRRTKNAGTTLKRAVRLIDQIRRTIGETSVRGQFDRLPVVLTVNRIIDDTDRPDIARSHTADMPDLTL